MIGVGYSLIGLLVLATTIGGIVADRYGERILVVTKKYSDGIIAGHT